MGDKKTKTEQVVARLEKSIDELDSLSLYTSNQLFTAHLKTVIDLLKRAQKQILTLDRFTKAQNMPVIIYDRQTGEAKRANMTQAFKIVRDLNDLEAREILSSKPARPPKNKDEDEYEDDDDE